MASQSIPHLIQRRDIIFIGHQSWDVDSIASNARDLALQFEINHNRVLYVNVALTRLDLWENSSNHFTVKRKRVLQGKLPDLERISSTFWSFFPRTFLEPVNRLRPAWVFNMINYINNRRLAKQILSAVGRLGFKNYILINDMEMYRGFYLKRMLKPETYLYYLRDNLIHTAYFKRNGSRLEPRLLASSDLVCCNSDYLKEYADKFSRNAYYVGQGCDTNHFNPSIDRPLPLRLKNVAKPLIGYAGALVSSRLDLPLIGELARQNPGWNFILVGPEDEQFRRSDLHHLSNVIFTGRVSHADLPAWISCFDVGINPQWVNEMTIGNYPRKADEYLAMGKPLVARHTQVMELFSAVCYLADDSESFSTSISRALREDSALLREKRREFALEHSWESHYAAVSRAYFSFKNPQEWKPGF